MLSKWETTEWYCYKLSLSQESPCWLSLAENEKEISLKVTAQQAKSQFPAAAFPACVFAEEPVWMECCQQVAANQLYAEQILSVKGQNLSYYKTGKGFREGTRYRMADGGGNIRFGILVSLTLQKCRNAAAVYRVIGGSDFFLLYTAVQQASGAFGKDQMEGLHLCFPDDCPLGTEEIQEVYLAVHFKEGQAFRFYFNCVAAAKGQAALALQGDNKALRTVLPQGTAGITVTIDESGLDDKEQLLAMEYQNLALEVEDAASHIISHETMPFMPEGSQDKKACSLAISYARALEGREADAGRFITEQRQLIFRLLWIDIYPEKLFLELDSLWDEKQQSYAPVNGAFSFQQCQIPGLGHVCFPSGGIPQPPAYRRKEDLEHGYAFVIMLRPLVHDTFR